MENLDKQTRELLKGAKIIGEYNGCPLYKATIAEPICWKEYGSNGHGINFLKEVEPGLFHRWYANGYQDGPRNYEFYIKFNWNFCNSDENEHEYSSYFSPIFGRKVCFTCDPLSENNRHRPIVSELLGPARRRLEDRIRKDSQAFQKAFTAVFN